jgi:hypothetical protein
MAGRAHAAGGVVFGDDAESGTTLTTDVPPGKWDSRRVNMGVTFSAVLGAGHGGGNSGLQLIDNHGVATSGNEGYLTKTVSASVDLYLRFWTSVQPVQLQGIESAVLMSPTGKFFLEVGLRPADCFIGGHDLNDIYAESTATGSYLDGGWHLVEASLIGVGSSTAQRTLWIDGEAKVQNGPVDLSGVSVSSLNLGEVYDNDRTFTGTITFDEVRLSTVRPGSTLTMTVAATATLTDCVPVAISLMTSPPSVPAPAPYDAHVTLGPPTAGTFFSDPGCTAPLTPNTASLLADTMTVQVYLRPASVGTMDLSASHVDFVSASATLQVSPGGDGGTPDGGANDGGTQGVRPLTVGCGCAQGASAAWLWATGIVALRAHARRQPRRAPSLPS